MNTELTKLTELCRRQGFSSVNVFPVQGFSEAKPLCFSAQSRPLRHKKARFLFKFQCFKFQENRKQAHTCLCCRVQCFEKPSCERSETAQREKTETMENVLLSVIMNTELTEL